MARVSTNPIAMGAPHGDEPIVLDFCTCVAAEGKVRVKWIAGQQCPDGWLLDNEGRPTNDPGDLYGDPPGTILPMDRERRHCVLFGLTQDIKETFGNGKFSLRTNYR